MARMIDPLARSARPGPVEDRSPSTDPTALLALAVEVQSLRELEGWEPIGLDLDNLTLAMRGEDGITGTTIRRLRRRAAVWSKLSDDVRAFLVAHVADHPGPRVCLFHAFGEVPPPEGWAIGTTRRLYEAHAGHPPIFDVANLLPRSQS